MAVEHLVQQGVRHLGIIALEGVWFAHERRDAAVEVCEQLNCSHSTFWLSEEKKLTPEALLEWHQTLPSQYALMGVNDNLAKRWLISHPPEIPVPMIIGIDNVEVICTSTRPTLSSVAWPLESMAHSICSSLQKQMEGQQDLDSIGVPPERVLVRESTLAWVSDDPLVQEAMRWIEARACEAISITDLVQALGCQRRHLERLFQKSFKKGPRWFIEHFRLEQAKTLLAEKDLGLEAISEQCGFQSTSWFCVRFKESNGKTPTQWRREGSSH